jgi:hypothetical protein
LVAFATPQQVGFQPSCPRSYLIVEEKLRKVSHRIQSAARVGQALPLSPPEKLKCFQSAPLTFCGYPNFPLQIGTFSGKISNFHQNCVNGSLVMLPANLSSGCYLSASSLLTE